MAFSPDGAIVATGSKDGKVRLFEAKGGAPMRTIDAMAGAVSSVLFSAATELVVLSGNVAGSVTRWSTATGTLLGKAPRADGYPPTRGALSAEGKLVAAIGYSRTDVVLLDSHSLAPTRSLKSPAFDRFQGVAFSTDGAFVAASSSSGALALWHTDSDQALLSLRVAPGLDAGIASTPDGYVELFGADAAVLRRLTRCVTGLRALPFEACAERFEAPGLFAKVVANDPSFREP